MQRFLQRHRKLSLKTALLNQEGFPGVGNWMADEILWQAGFSPGGQAARLSPAQARLLGKVVRRVCARPLRTIGVDDSDPPSRWQVHVRWERPARCPRDKRSLRLDLCGGRTTLWCPRCQR